MTKQNGFYKASLWEFPLLQKLASQLLKILQFWWLVMILFFITLITMNFLFSNMILQVFWIVCHFSYWYAGVFIHSKYEPFIDYIHWKISFLFVMGPRVKRHQLLFSLNVERTKLINASAISSHQGAIPLSNWYKTKTISMYNTFHLKR